MPNISVIIPIYNSENFLQNCVESILKQTYEDFELILVNDGSLDNSLEICNIFASQDSRIQVLDKPNGGVSSARNMGINHAKGEFIAFVDSDDVVCSNYLKLLLNNIKNSDISMGAVRLLDVGIDTELSVLNNNYTLNSFKENCENTFKGHYINSPCNKLFKKAIIKENALQFRTDMKMGEDAVFVLSYLGKCTKISCFSEVIYVYNRVDVNQVKSYNPQILQDRIIMCNYFKKFFANTGTTADILVLREYLSAIEEDLKLNKEIKNKESHFENFIAQNNLDAFIQAIKVPFIKKILAYNWLTLLKKQQYSRYLEKYI